MRNKVQRPNPSQLRLAPSVSTSVSTQNPPSHAHMKKVMNPQAKHLEHQRSTLSLLVTTVNSLASPSSPSTAPSLGASHTQVRNACIASTPVVPSSCRMCTPILTQPSWLSSPSCGTRASFDHHNQIVCDRNDAFLARTAKPAVVRCRSLETGF